MLTRKTHFKLQHEKEIIVFGHQKFCDFILKTSMITLIHRGSRCLREYELSLTC